VPEGYQDAVAAFDARFTTAYGSKPSWGKRQGGQIKTLLRAHGRDEVLRRIAILFDSPPSWLKGPFDLGTLVLHFDKLVVAVVSDRSTGRAEPQRPEDYEADRGRAF
jgi:hypothetical protein